MHIGADLFAVL